MRSASLISGPRRIGWIFQGILLVCGALAVILLGLAWLGFPRILTGWILASANHGDFFITAHDVKLNLRGGVTATDVQVYRKGVIGPPCLETRELRVLFRLFERPHAGESRIKELSARGGIIRPAWAPAGQMGTGTVAVLNGSLGPSNSIKSMDMDVILGDFDVLGVWVDQIKTTLNMDHDGMCLSRLTGQVGRDLQRGNVEGALSWKWDRQIAGRLVTSFDPHALASLVVMICPAAMPVMDRFSFSSSPPRFDLSFEADRGSSLKMVVKGRMQASQYAYQGAGIGFANINGDYVYGNGTNRLSLDQFLVVVGGRQINGKAGFDFTAGTTRFEMMSAVDLATTLRLAGRKDHGMDSWRFPDGARVTARGLLSQRTPNCSDVEAVVEGPSLGCGPLWIQDYGFNFNVHGLTNLLSDIHAKIGGGSCAGSVTMIPDGSDTGLTSHIKGELIYADVDEFLKLLTPNRVWRTDGKLFGNIELHGQGGLTELEKITGSGQITLRNARLFRTSLFAGLMAELNRQMPGLDWRAIPVDIRASFVIRNGRAESQDIRIEDGVVGLTAQGSCGRDGSLDFTIQAHVAQEHGLIGKALRALGSADKPVEFTLGGTVESPKWTVVKSK